MIIHPCYNISSYHTSGQAWQDVTEATRRAYAQSQFILGACEVALHGNLKECLRRLDMALLMGPPEIHTLGNSLIDVVHSAEVQNIGRSEGEEKEVSSSSISSSSSSSSAAPEAVAFRVSEGSQKRLRPTPMKEEEKKKKEDDEEEEEQNRDSIRRIACPSLQTFFRDYLQTQVQMYYCLLIIAMEHFKVTDRKYSNIQRYP